jgi:hypothetical protein
MLGGPLAGCCVTCTAADRVKVTDWGPKNWLQELAEIKHLFPPVVFHDAKWRK